MPRYPGDDDVLVYGIDDGDVPGDDLIASYVSVAFNCDLACRACRTRNSLLGGRALLYSRRFPLAA